MKSNPSGKSKIEKRDSALESLLHSEHIVKIEKMAVGGDGVGRIQFNEKPVVVFVKKTAPQDQLKIKITAVEKNFLKGEIVQIIEPGPHRRSPPCKFAGQCGGCSWQQISDHEQVAQKENLLKELFQKFIPEVSYSLAPTILSPKILGYRNRIQLKHDQNQFGYFRDETHEIVDIDSCLIADERISKEIPILKNKLKSSNKLEKYELKINTNNEFEYYKIGTKGEGLSFSQVNSFVNHLLIETTLELIQKMTNIDQLTELYAGAGNFTFEILNKFPQLTAEAAELNPELTKYAIQKIQQNRLQKRLVFFTTDCASYVKRRNLSGKLVFVDPPRAGLEDEVISAMIKTVPENILCVSCHPVSLARDLQKFFTKSSKKYKIEHLQIFDMFPQTDHFETLVWFKRC